jgi:hypothetical protein
MRFLNILGPSENGNSNGNAAPSAGDSSEELLVSEDIFVSGANRRDHRNRVHIQAEEFGVNAVYEVLQSNSIEELAFDEAALMQDNHYRDERIQSLIDDLTLKIEKAIWAHNKAIRNIQFRISNLQNFGLIEEADKFDAHLRDHTEAVETLNGFKADIANKTGIYLVIHRKYSTGFLRGVRAVHEAAVFENLND